MDHPVELEILNYLGGYLSESETRRVEEHLDQCHACRRVLADCQETWNALGQARIDTSGHDLVERIMEKLSASPVESTPKAKSDKRWLTMTRIAACLGLAVVLGHLVGVWSMQKPTAYWQTRAAEAIYLEALAPRSATGFSHLILQGERTENDL